MNKHRDALNSVRDVILLDEIESLRERYEEQRASYNQQIADAYGSGIDTANSFDSGWEAAKKTLYADVATDYGAAGRASATSWTEGFRNYMSQGGIISTIWKLILGEDTYAKWTGGRTKEAQANGALLGASYADIMTLKVATPAEVPLMRWQASFIAASSSCQRTRLTKAPAPLKSALPRILQSISPAFWLRQHRRSATSRKSW